MKSKEDLIMRPKTGGTYRIFDLGKILAQLAKREPRLTSASLFGSRRYSTGSLRSDIDLLIKLSRREVSYQLSDLGRALEPYLDLFQDIGGLAVNLGNRSQIKVASGDVGSALDAIPVWDRSKGWIGPPWARRPKVLEAIIPPYTMAEAFGGFDPAMPRTDVLVVTALDQEYKALIRRFPSTVAISAAPPLPPHVQAQIKTNRGFLDVVLCRSHRMGNTSAALTTVEVARYWSPKLVVLIGIAAGIKGDVRLGDIVIPDRIVEYEATKITRRGEHMHGLVRDTSPLFRARIFNWPRRDAWLKQWSRKRPLGSAAQPMAFRGDAMASGHKVVALAARAKRIARVARKTISIEMEAIGVAEACSLFEPQVPFLVIKAVSDYADSTKNDRWHSFCCEAVADLIASSLEDSTLLSS